VAWPLGDRLDKSLSLNLQTRPGISEGGFFDTPDPGSVPRLQRPCAERLELRGLLDEEGLLPRYFGPVISGW